MGHVWPSVAGDTLLRLFSSGGIVRCLASLFPCRAAYGGSLVRPDAEQRRWHALGDGHALRHEVRAVLGAEWTERAELAR